MSDSFLSLKLTFLRFSAGLDAALEYTCATSLMMLILIRSDLPGSLTMSSTATHVCYQRPGFFFFLLHRKNSLSELSLATVGHDVLDSSIQTENAAIVRTVVSVYVPN